MQFKTRSHKPVYKNGVYPVLPIANAFIIQSSTVSLAIAEQNDGMHRALQGSFLRHNPILKAFGERLLASGHAPKAVIGAAMGKRCN